MTNDYISNIPNAYHASNGKLVFICTKINLIIITDLY